MKCITLLFAGISVLLHQLAAAINGTLVAQDFRELLSQGSGIYLASDENWENETTQRWNLWNAPTYVVSVKPALVEDVQKVVQYVSQHNYSFLATGGGHGYTGSLGALDNGIELDMGNFNTVQIDANSSILRTGGSVRFRDIMPVAYSAGKAFPVGACPCVGATGAALGGGIGFYSGFYGAISDGFESLEIITGTGDLIKASETENSDLFWAMKGAGANYGVVTTVNYRVSDYPNGGQVFTADFVFPAGANRSILEFAASFVGNQPKELSVTLGFLYSAAAQELLVVANVIYVGPETRGREIVQPLVDLSPVTANISYIPWKDVAYVANLGAPAASCLSRQISIPHSVNLYEVDVDGLVAAVEVLQDTARSNPSLRSFVFALTQYAPYGFQQHASNTSAFAYRNVKQFAQLDITAESDDDIPEAESFGREFRDRLQTISGSDALQVYTNFGFGDEGADAWYTAENVPRLRKLKEQYDPQRLFHFYNPVDRD